MPNQIYAYKCPECQQPYDSPDRVNRLDIPCQVCTFPGPLVRVFQVQIQKPMMEHWNTTLQKPVSDMRQFKDGLKEAGENSAKYTGIETDYQPIDATDAEACGVTSEGLDVTNRVRVAEGRKPISLKGL